MCISKRYSTQTIFFPPHIYRTLDMMDMRTRCSAHFLTFCNKFYGKRTQKRLDIPVDTSYLNQLTGH